MAGAARPHLHRVRLGYPALVELAQALRSGRLAPAYTPSGLARHVPGDEAPAVTAALVELHADGMQPRHIARCLDLLAEERRATQKMADRVRLVWSPPNLDHVDSRDTAVVVQALFAQAKESVLVVSYAIDDGDKATALFGKLAERMDADPGLSVRVIANVHRPHLDPTPAGVLVQAFAARFQAQLWPGQRLPEVYHFPASLALEGHQRASLHAKCIVIDRRWSLLTSANLTEAAQHRNLEAGLLVDDPSLAQRLALQFEWLCAEAVLLPVRMGAS